MINDLMKKTLAGDKGAEGTLKTLLGMDDLNWEYFFTLYKSKLDSTIHEPVQIYEEGKDTRGKTIVYPTAIASPEMMKALPWRDLATLRSSPEKYAEEAKRANL